MQKRLFNYFSDEFFPDMEMLVPPEDDLADAISDEELDILNILKRYKNYLVQNHDWLFKEEIILVLFVEAFDEKKLHTKRGRWVRMSERQWYFGKLVLHFTVPKFCPELTALYGFLW